MNRDAYGFGLSFVMHASILGICLYLLPALDLQPKPLVIDFSLISNNDPHKNYAAPLKQERSIKPLPVLESPPEPKQLAIPKPIKKVLPKAPPKPVIVKKVLTRPAEKILPGKEEKVANKESLPEVTENVVQPEPETFSPEPVMQPRVATQESNSPIQTDSSAGVLSSGVSRQEMGHHYVKAHFIYIKKIIEKNISYPPMARRMGWQGKVVVSFIVCSNGKVENLQIVESSGHVQLDKNALETVKQVEPFPSPPVRVKLVLPVMYRIT
ncbi:MAG: energy transducer TonB [Desulfobacterales bacterium]